MRLSYNYQHNKKSAPFQKKPIKLKRRSSSLYGQRPSTLTWLLKKAFLVGLIGFFGGGIVFLGLIGWYSRDLPDPNKLIERALPISTKIYDRTGKNLLYEIHGSEQRSLVSISDIPDHVKWATIVAEDKNFYSHKGFDAKGILRALIIDVLRGKKAQGGSTITQQFIKNSLLTSEKSIGRKLKELVLAYQLEKRFSKDQILQLYFNEIPYGSTAYGVQAASMLYFGKSVQNLTLAQSAILASLPKAPTYYSPWGNHQDKLIARQQALLDAMAEEGYISEEEARIAKEEKLEFRESRQSITAPHFVFYAKELLSNLFGEKLVEEGGLSVITSLDYEKQKVAEEVVKKWGKKNLSMNATNASLVSLDTHTGEVLAMVGSRDYFEKSIDGNVNVALRPRQPGSSIKPIVYAAAFQRGYTPNTIVFDVTTNFDVTGEKPYKPQNYTGKQYGPVTLRKALSGSLNIASVKVLYLTGVRTVIEFAKTLGYSTLQDPARYGLALVLGGGEVTLLEHTAAFAAFAQEGKRVEPVVLLRVEDSRGRVLYQSEKKESQEIFDKEIARQISDILSDTAARTYVFGNNPYLSLPGRPAALKTGTTNDFRDAWTVGYTPSFATGVWVGNNNNSVMKKGADGSKLAAPIWNEYMKTILAKTEVEVFTKPLLTQTGKPVLDGTLLPNSLVKIDSTTGKLATVLTPPSVVIEKPLNEIHSILYYVDKDNPRGDPPQDPSRDPQFLLWESTVQKWAEKQGYKKTTTSPPQTPSQELPSDSNHTLTILSPQENDTITSNELTISVATTSPHGIARVEYYIDNQILDTLSQEPYTLQHMLSGIENGFHVITVKSFDTTGKSTDASVTVNFLLIKKAPSILWKSPTPSQTFKGGGSIPIQFDLILPEENIIKSIKKISILYSPQNSQEKYNIATIIGPQETSYTIPWKPPQTPAVYTLTVQLIDQQGLLLSQKRISLPLQ